MFSAGKLRHRVIIQRLTGEQDSSTGAIDEQWEDVATVWAAIEPISAREFVTSQAEASKVTARITMRYRSDIDATCRLYHPAKDKFYNVEGILADKESGLEYLTLPCSEGVRHV